MSLDGHSGPASCILFDPIDSNHLYSGSWDHSVRIWDIEAESNIHTMNCEKIVVCMEHSIESNMIVTGHEDGVMRLWDPRSKGISLVIFRWNYCQNEVIFSQKLDF